MPRPPAPAANTKSASAPIGLIAGVVAAVVALIAVFVFLAVRDDGMSATGSAQSLPEGGGVVVNTDAPTDAAEVHIFEDFQCPYCGQLENAIGDEVQQAVADGEVKVTYTFMSFLDPVSSNESSSRAANAAVCSSEAGILPEWHQNAFAEQPTEGAGYEDEVFISAAEEAGLEGAELDTFQSCVADGTFADYVQDMATAANEAGVTSTPTVLINGEPVTGADLTTMMDDPSSFQSIVDSYAQG